MRKTQTKGKKPPEKPDPQEDCVYVLIGFALPYLEAKRARHKEELRHERLRKMERAGGKDVSKQMAAQRERMKAFMPEFFRACHSGRANLGIFQSKKEILDIITSQGYGISEAGYYNTLLIERKPLGYQAFDWGKGTETWLQLKEDDKYHVIRKPACFRGIFGFA
jgi:hypothetical protein